jgi:hypothetical protein|tara:strand:+ start:322 stop:534 length:213 start_codon:yes stop_codon:yes gene_type:complete
MKTALILFFIGTVDFIENGVVSAEITTSHRTIEEVELPVQLFPCEIRESDIFYFVYVDGVTEIRCGEPPR